MSNREESIAGFKRRWCFDSTMPIRFPLYAAYLDALELGQRKTAYEKFAKPLISALSQGRHEDRLALTDSIWRAINHVSRNPNQIGAEGFPYGFFETISIPTLKQQILTNPDDAYSTLWLALSHPRFEPFHNNDELLAKAHNLRPHDPFICERFAEYKMQQVWYACHHIPDGLLATIDEIQRDLNLLRRQIPFISPARVWKFEGFIDEHQTKLNGYIDSSRASSK